ncbi:MAG: hypothetical protein WBP59_15975, partial [Ilumatobacteraceae bacterium]
FRQSGDDIELAASLRERGFAEVFGGSLKDAEWLLGEAEALSDRLGDGRGRAWVRQHQAWSAFLSGDTELAETRLMAAAEEFDLLGDRAGRGWALGLLAYVRFFQRRFEESEELAVKVRAESVELGDRWAPAMMDSLIASIRLWTTRFSEAEELSRKALTGFRELNDRFGVVQALGPRLRALIALGRLHEAERGLEEALTMSESYGNLSFPAVTAAGAAVHLGLGVRGVSIAELAVERGTRMGAEGSESSVTLALALCQAGRADDALAILEGIERDFPYAAAVTALASALTGDAAASIELAAGVSDEVGATYLDVVIAAIAAAASEGRLGIHDAARARLDSAKAVAADAGDVVAKELVAAMSAGMVGEGPVADRYELAVGWRTVVDGLIEMAGMTPVLSEE